MNTSTTRQHYTVITVNYSGYCDLIKDKTIKVLNTVRTLLNDKIDVYAMPYMYTCQIEHITEDQPMTEYKPSMTAKVISINDPLERLRQNKVKFEVGSYYDYGYIIEIVKRTEKTVTYKTPGHISVTTRKISDYELGYESFYPDKNTVCSVKSKVRSPLPMSNTTIKTEVIEQSENNIDLSTFKAGQVYKIGDRVDIAVRITEVTSKTVKVHFLISVYDKKSDSFQWWESKEDKLFKLKTLSSPSTFVIDYNFMNINRVSVRSNVLNPVNLDHSVKTAINNTFLPKEVHQKLFALNGSKTGSYYWYDLN